MRVEELLDELQDMMNDAKPMPLTGGKVLIEAEKVLDIIDEIKDTLPSEVRQAKNIVSDRTQIIAEAKKEAEEIIRAAKEKREQLINHDEIVKEAKAKSMEIIADTNARNDEMKKAAVDFVEDIMKQTDDAITAQLAELRKTRQNFKMTRKGSGSASN